jgi:hypothetical protein
MVRIKRWDETNSWFPDFYIGCQLAGTWKLGFNELFGTAAQFSQAPYWLDNEAQGQFATLIMNTQSQTVVFDNLSPNLWYECRGIASYQFRNSSIVSYSFQTGTNGAVMSRWVFNHATYPTERNRQALLCILNQLLGVPSYSIVAMTGETCGNATQMYEINNSTGGLAIYFFPLDLEVDNLMTVNTLKAILTTPDNMTALNQTYNSSAVAGPGFLNITYDDTVPYNVPQVVWPTTIAVGETWLSFEVSLNMSGFIMAAVGQSPSDNVTIPNIVPVDFKRLAALNANNLQEFVGVQILYYDTTEAQTFNFSNLADSTEYTVYVAACNDNPYWWANYSVIETFNTSTINPNGVTEHGVSLMASLFVSCFLVVLSLIL